MIRKIHQLSKTSVLKDFEKESQIKLKKLNKDYEYKLWTDEDLKNLFKENNLELYNLWDKMRGVQKSDLGRYLILYLEGGFYCDTDFYINQKLDDLGNLEKTYFSPSTPDFIFMNSGFTNYFIYSPGGDAIFLKIIDESIKRIRETRDYNQPSYVSYTTGKILLESLVVKENYKVNIFSEKKIVNKYCNFTDTRGSFGYHDGGTSRKDKTDSWVNNYVTSLMEVECSMRKNFKIKGNLCQIPVVFIFILFVFFGFVFYLYKHINKKHK